MKHRIHIAAALFLLSAALQAQKNPPDTSYKNTIRINVTPLLVTTRLASFTMGYERVLFQHQTVSVNIGHLQLPDLITTNQGDPVQWVSELHNSGFLASVDYRFYFKRNRYTAPDGLYWGPYFAYYYFDKKGRAQLFNNNIARGSADVQAYFSMANVGLQMGYQFVLGKRWTVDLIFFGPGMGFYDLTVNIDADASLNVDGEDYQAVYDKLVSLFPAIQQLFDEQEINSSGTQSFNGLGYRMVVQVGFRF